MFKFDVFKMNKKTQIVLLFLVLFFFTAGLFYYYEYLQSKTVIKKYPSNQVVLENKNNNKITVYICGEVKKAGIYHLSEGLRVKDAIDMAQGFTANADINKINLAEKIYDEDKIYVPSKKKKTSANKIKKDATKEKHNKISKKYKKSYQKEYEYQKKELDENDMLISEGIIEIKINGRVKSE